MTYTYSMEPLLLAIFLTLTIATVLNIILKIFGISHIIGYILTGTIISHIFQFFDGRRSKVRYLDHAQRT